MRCPFCSFSDSKVTDSRTVENGIRRRRECQRCSLRFTTYERIQAAALMVSKRDNRREEFNREKLISGLRKACAKRPVSSRTIEKLVEDIEAELQHLGHVEVPTSILGTMVMDRLKNLDRVAYLRYASVYRDFQDIESFERAVQDLREDSTQLPLPESAPVPARRRRRRGSATAARYRPRNINPYRNNTHQDDTKGDAVDEQ
ncbi:MAG: transcriptional regulator NrdR [Chloroflexota bacterium]